MCQFTCEETEAKRGRGSQYKSEMNQNQAQTICQVQPLPSHPISGTSQNPHVSGTQRKACIHIQQAAKLLLRTSGACISLALGMHT